MRDSNHTQVQSDILTIRGAVVRAKSEGMIVAENAVRRWVSEKRFPIRKSGNRTLIYYPQFLEYLRSGL